MDDMLVAIEENSQNWNAENTPWMLASFVENNSKRSLPTGEGRDRFCGFLAARDLDWNFRDVIGLFEKDDWRRPENDSVEEQENGDGYGAAGGQGE